MNRPSLLFNIEYMRHLQKKMLRKSTFIAQGSYYLLTGIWPIIHIGSFMAVTGYKTDIWLVKMVALLSTTIGIQLLLQLSKNPGPKLLSVMTALSFLLIDTYYALHGTISKIYLADAMAQVIFIVSVLLTVQKRDSA
ncbi:hypothetical protein QF042_003518 [Pedobacter sp. W3I1]|uniref:hypothetical protein n=1 Tax=Pedobacter sp. W3I1 TaxID=3042291 RepID=UPI002781D676|nr:hypothetical protein [Pedobacter sp. W3I1]MDQ0639953.1 hypothetical protein [Pedobacter sp. W3I1]